MRSAKLLARAAMLALACVIVVAPASPGTVAQPALFARRLAPFLGAPASCRSTGGSGWQPALPGRARVRASSVKYSGQAAGHCAGGRPAGAAAVEAALRRRLDRQYLSYQWVVCVKMDRFYKGRRLWRCNVDFGDPHIVQYCAILAGHTLVTDRENHALDCDRRP